MEQQLENIARSAGLTNDTAGALYLPALPDLTPLHEKLIGADITFSKRAMSRLESACDLNNTISPAHYAHKHITPLLRTGVEMGLFDHAKVVELLGEVATCKDLNDFVKRVSESIVSTLAQPVIEAVNPCKNALAALGYDFDDMDIGVISMRDTDSHELVYYIDEPMRFLRYYLEALSEPVKTAVIMCLRSFGALAQIEVLAHETRDWEMYYTIEQMPLDAFEQLAKMDYSDGSFEDVLNNIQTIMGEKTYSDFASTCEDYMGLSDEDDGWAEMLVERTETLVDELIFDRLPYFSKDNFVKNTHFADLASRIQAILDTTENDHERTVLTQLLTLVNTAAPFIWTEESQMKSDSDITLWSQQYMHFVHLNDMVCIPRAESLEEHLMNTAEMALMIIDPHTASSVNDFTNMQIGYLLMRACSDFLGEKDD
ncbi:hypothetical protein [Alteromonas macleodii]|uniref:Uncharacterized protein n=1 Tax=Alteromonas macleodii TaxID=28108 RepID=A0AB36FLL7_ALTMA|nr:hypothetical protein [Alteromonas macleodii]OES24115.1 hypothetical protein BFV95_4860 [Alteromonas macleodii]OES24122.1 hypothetical protein BFV94_4871 [Alteromonas macleodii]OES25884.1 hypothetical protein BFV93_4254 [Alteromonas macleodii]OES38611.1 hypothetical protein BFV96_4722 [Alteromonas macleodii]OES38957.1 hypothetical protein BFV96_4451 [Alteromonas macleodii]